MESLETEIADVLPLRLERCDVIDYNQRAQQEGFPLENYDNRDVSYLVQETVAYSNPGSALDFFRNSAVVDFLYVFEPWMKQSAVYQRHLEDPEGNLEVVRDAMRQRKIISVKLKDPETVLIQEVWVPNEYGNRGGTVDFRLSDSGLLYCVRAYLGGHHDKYELKESWGNLVYHRPVRGILSEPFAAMDPAKVDVITI